MIHAEELRVLEEAVMGELQRSVAGSNRTIEEGRTERRRATRNWRPTMLLLFVTHLCIYIIYRTPGSYATNVECHSESWLQRIPIPASDTGPLWLCLPSPIPRLSSICPVEPKFYVSNKTTSERRLMSYGDHNKEGENSSLEVVVLSCGLVGGGALVGKTTGVEHLISPLTGDTVTYRVLAFLQKLLCSVPLVHQDDACEAHVFCMGVPLTHGRRFLCASSYPTLREIIAYYQQNHAAHRIEPEECQDSSIKGGSTKLRDVGFEYKYGMDQILDDSVQFAKKVGLLKDG